MQCGLLGQKLSHSYSPQIHSLLGDYPYTLFEINPDALDSFMRSNRFDGLNVTIPYKKSVIPYCSKLSPVAKRLGAVNTIVRDKNGDLIGHNTDYFGFSSLLDRCGLMVSGKKVLVLGSGGASNTVCAVLQERKANVVVISRTGENNYTNLTLHSDASVIVNTTPVGMYPNTGKSPVDISLFPKLEGVLDLIYNPARTQILLDAEKRGLVAENGLWMLVAQAKESAEWFTGQEISQDSISHIYKTLQKQMHNIVLIGMPGCGKSTIGKALAEKLGRPFYDADEEIIKATGQSIPDIFSAQGEAGFRKLETEILSRLSKKTGSIISTGGGCVTIPNNYAILKENGVVIWIKRDISKLPTEGRPLSAVTSLSQMYDIRKPMYAAFADHIVTNDSSVDQVLAQILALEDV